MKVLVVEDDADISSVLTFYFEAKGHEVVIARDGLQALERFSCQDLDLMLLDIMLPKLDGWAVLEAVRAKCSLPVILLTALGEEDDRIAGLEAGADDYLTKPFSPRELALRVRSVLRRSPAPVGLTPVELKVGALTISAAARSVTVDGQPVSLTNREFDLLLFFISHADTVFTREELLKQVWHWDFGDLSTVTVHVKRLRSKLADHHRVQTVWGRGYMWSGAAGTREGLGAGAVD